MQIESLCLVLMTIMMQCIAAQNITQHSSHLVTTSSLIKHIPNITLPNSAINIVTHLSSRTNKSYTKKKVGNITKQRVRRRSTRPIPNIFLHDLNQSLLLIKPTSPTTMQTTLASNITRKTRTTLYITPFTKRPGTTKPCYVCPLCYQQFRKSPRLQLHMHKKHNLSIHVTIRKVWWTHRGPVLPEEHLNLTALMQKATFIGEVQYDAEEELRNFMEF